MLRAVFARTLKAGVSYQEVTAGWPGAGVAGDEDRG